MSTTKKVVGGASVDESESLPSRGARALPKNWVLAFADSLAQRTVPRIERRRSRIILALSEVEIAEGIECHHL